MLIAVAEVGAAGESLGVTAKEFVEDPCKSVKRTHMVKAARALLAGEIVYGNERVSRWVGTEFCAVGTESVFLDIVKQSVSSIFRIFKKILRERTTGRSEN